jgi:NADH dehydrogenase [ubiquinone] 1 alpha subcomplex assembly factor 7
MSRLQPILIDLIRREGPISIARYMALALGHPEHGYYMKKDPLGARGDFTTAPEISQMFGELIGLWIADLWQRAGSPAPFHLIELGPGRGTLMADALRAMTLLPGLRDAARVHLVEMGPTLKAKQEAALQGTAVHWHTSLNDALKGAEGPAIVIANEFLDALPIRQLVRSGASWRERLVGVSEDGSSLVPVLSRQTPPEAALLPPALAHAPEGNPDGSIAEICPAALDLVGDLSHHLRAQGGAALFIDYGYTRSAFGDSFQALKAHDFADPFKDPGDADLTAHVDFDRFSVAGSEAGLTVHGPTTQGNFLSALGIENRADRLIKASPDRAQDIAQARDRLIGNDAMGSLFKALALSAPNWPTPAGFAP